MRCLHVFTKKPPPCLLDRTTPERDKSAGLQNDLEQVHKALDDAAQQLKEIQQAKVWAARGMGS